MVPRRAALRDGKKANSKSLTGIGKERRWVPIPTARVFVFFPQLRCIRSR